MKAKYKQNERITGETFGNRCADTYQPVLLKKWVNIYKNIGLKHIKLYFVQIFVGHMQ